ncbi:MAG TPA: glycosyltransferase [Caldilineae bacterium]|nr:glycosyltransferase [Caldilineae bacterium]
MHLLVLTPQFPYPPHQGTTLRNYNLLKGLAERHVIDLFSMLAPGDKPERGPVPELVRHLVTAEQPARTMGRRLRDLVTSSKPDMALRLWDENAFAALLAHVLDNPPEIIQVEGIEMAPYVLAMKDTGLQLPRLIYDAHNAETLLQRRAFQADLRRPSRWVAAAYSAVQTAKLDRYERRLLAAVDGVAAVSVDDEQVLQRMAPGLRTTVVTNGVDLEAYNPAGLYANLYQHAGANLLFTGKMDFRPNVDGVLWFANQVLPRLRATELNPHFWIVGRNPHKRLDALRNRLDVTVTGAVPDIQPYIAHADLYVVPLLAGGGTRLKILEAMAMARPIVSTRLGADGFPVTDGEELALADSAEDFAARCASLLRNRAGASEMGERGRAFVEAHYSWERIIPKMEELY